MTLLCHLYYLVLIVSLSVLYYLLSFQYNALLWRLETDKVLFPDEHAVFYVALQAFTSAQIVLLSN